MFGWHCEGWRLRDPSGRTRGADTERRRATCRGQIVLQERLRPMASAFEDGEREAWLRRAVEAIRAVPDSDRAWPPETLGVWGSEEQKMFPASRRKWPCRSHSALFRFLPESTNSERCRRLRSTTRGGHPLPQGRGTMTVRPCPVGMMNNPAV